MESSGGEGGSPDRPEYNVYRSGDEKSRSRRAAPKRAAEGDDRPDYKVYRSRRVAGKLRGGDLGGFRERLRREQRPEEEPRRRPMRGEEPERRRPPVRRYLRLAALAVGVWFALSVALFVVSAQIQKGKLDGSAANEVGGLPLMLASGQTVLVIGTDARQAGTGEPGAETRSRCLDQAAQGETPHDGCSPFRADTLLLVRAGGGAFEKLSIPRDSYAAIPGQANQKINGAYAFGGASLQIRAVESFLGLDIDHVVVLDFDGFIDLIDAIGGVKVDVPGPFKSKINGGLENGGITLKLSKGEHVLDGDRALAYARTRQNLRNPAENDLDRARRQQDILSGIQSRMTSPWRAPINFARGPWIAWAAPKAMVSDMGGFMLPQLAVSIGIGGGAKDRVLKPSGPGPGGSILIDQAECERAVEKFLGHEGPRTPACSPV
jgi:LCP family protein required for cell wall assembly